FVDFLETRDQQLDPRVVGENLRGRFVITAEEPAQDRVEEEHRVRAEGPVRPACLQEMDRRARQSAELDLARHPLDQLVAGLLASLVREAHAWTVRSCPEPPPDTADPLSTVSPPALSATAASQA